MSTFKQIIVVVLVITIWGVVDSCSNNRKEKVQQNQTPLTTNPTPIYDQPLYCPPVTTSEQQTTEQAQKTQREEPTDATPKNIQPTITISKYYEEGYDNGYDDGEDDAESDNGWGGQFDDSCRYKGKARKDYQLGYEEGYETGYYDNKAGDE